MFKIKDEKLAKQIEQSTVTREEFEALLDKTCQVKPKPSPKASGTKAVRPVGDCIETDTR
jgi:hypothetical protein